MSGDRTRPADKRASGVLPYCRQLLIWKPFDTFRFVPQSATQFAGFVFVTPGAIQIVNPEPISSATVWSEYNNIMPRPSLSRKTARQRIRSFNSPGCKWSIVFNTPRPYYSYNCIWPCIISKLWNIQVNILCTAPPSELYWKLVGNDSSNWFLSPPPPPYASKLRAAP